MSDTEVISIDYCSELFGYPVDDPRINALSSYTDGAGIRHIYVEDTNTAWELLRGEWIEKAPF